LQERGFITAVKDTIPDDDIETGVTDKVVAIDQIRTPGDIRIDPGIN